MSRKCPHCDVFLTTKEAKEKKCPVCKSPLHGKPTSPAPLNEAIDAAFGGASGYPKRFKTLGRIFATIGLLIGGIYSARLWEVLQSKPAGIKAWVAFLISPLVAAGFGALFAFCLAGATAPTSFFNEAKGERLLKVCGTKNVNGARVVFTLSTLVAGGILGILLWLALTIPPMN